MNGLLRRFSPWVPWAERGNVSADLSRPGVYLLAQAMRKPSKGRLSRQIIYIGETCGQSLHSRLYQFNRSAYGKKPAHSGGLTFAKLKLSSSPLFVSVLASPEEGPSRASAFIRYVERALLWSYVKEHGNLPRCNRK